MMNCPECFSKAVRRGTSEYPKHRVHYNQCKEHPEHRFKTIEIYADDIPEIEGFLAESEEVSKDCPYCRNGEQNQLLNSETAEDTDIEVFVGRLGDVLRVKHYDLEGGTYDAREMVAINFCPMCGRSLKK